jgi:hypothetical protein
LSIEPLGVSTWSRVELPLHPGEVDAPLVARARTGAPRRRFGEHLPWDRHLDRPALVAIVRAVERAAEIHRGPQPADVPGVNGGAAVAVGLNQQEIPDGVQRVDFDLEIRVRIAVGVDEDLEVVVLEDDRVALRQGPPEVGFFQIRPKVQELVVPEHLDASGERRAPSAVDVDKGIGPGRCTPGPLREPAVDLERSRRPVADRAARREGQLLEVRRRRLGPQRRQEDHDTNRRDPVQSRHRWGRVAKTNSRRIFGDRAGAWILVRTRYGFGR